MAKPLYRPLDQKRHEIRLIEIQPGVDANDPIECRLQHMSLLEPRPYDAASYVWGDATTKADIILDGILVEIPASAERVVRFFRLPNAPRIFWIDAICINQDDVDERSAQVAIMADVYRLSTRSIVHLRIHTEDDKEAMEQIEELTCDMLTDQNHEALLLSNDWEPTAPLDKSYDALVELIRQPWFGRLWVLQEAALPPSCRVYFGSRDCELEYLLRACTWLAWKSTPYRRNELLRGYRVLRMCDRKYRNPTRDISAQVTRCLFSASSYTTSDPRDRIYGFYGLLASVPERSGSVLQSLLKPNYNLHTGDVYRRATLFILYLKQNLWLLRYVLHHEPEDVCCPNFSSWALRYDRMSNRLWPDYSGFDAACGLSMERLDEPALHYAITSGVLRVKGFKYDRIIVTKAVAGPRVYARTLSAREISDAWIAIYAMLRQHSLPVPIKAIASTMAFGVAGAELQRPNEATFFRATDVLMAQHGLRYRSTKTTTSDRGKTFDEDQMQDFDQFEKAAALQCPQHVFFITSKGRVGLASIAVLEGDTVNVIAGSDVPLVFRQDGDRQRFVTECYVYGIMDGEAVTEHLAAGGAITDFSLV